MDPWAIYKPLKNNFHLIPNLVKSKLRRVGATSGKTKELRILRNSKYPFPGFKVKAPPCAGNPKYTQCPNKIS